MLGVLQISHPHRNCIPYQKVDFWLTCHLSWFHDALLNVISGVIRPLFREKWHFPYILGGEMFIEICRGNRQIISLRGHLPCLSPIFSV